MLPSKGTTNTNLRLRAGPGTDHATVTVVPAKTEFEALEKSGDWYKVKVNNQDGFFHSGFVTLHSQRVERGFINPAAAAPPPAAAASSGEPKAAPNSDLLTSEIATAPMEVPAEQKLPVNPKAPLTERLIATIWNKAGNLLTLLANQLKVDPGAAIAVLAVESGGKAFAADGRMLIRFENQVFWDQWGSKAGNADKYNQHFVYNPTQRWLEHKWRRSPDAGWQDVHTGHAGEWDTFSFARTLNDKAAKMSISMGGAQIMGFNHAACGYESVHDMFDAFSSSERYQIIGFFDFVQGPSTNSRRVTTLQEKDFVGFAALYNGPGQANRYGGLIKSVYDTYLKMRGLA